jgi:hypothetical protein
MTEEGKRFVQVRKESAGKMLYERLQLHEWRFLKPHSPTWEFDRANIDALG